MGSLIGSCAGAFCASLVCGACGKIPVAKKGSFAKMPYLVILVLSGVFAMLMSLYGEKHWNLGNISSVSVPPGNSSVFRVSMVLFLFETLHFVLIALGFYAFHYQMFGIKLLAFVAALIVAFAFGDNATFDNFADLSRFFLSPVYLLLQLILLITWTYDVNDAILGKVAEFWYWALFLSSLAIYAVCFTFLALFFDWYSPGNCQTHDAIIGTAIAFVVLNLILSIVAGGSNAPLRLVFPSAIVSLYSVFLTYGAMQGDTDDHCNRFALKRNTAVLWIGIVISLFGLAFAVLRSDLPSVFVELDQSEENQKLHEEKSVSRGKKESLTEDRVRDQIELQDSNYDDGDDVEPAAVVRSEESGEESESEEGSLLVADKHDASCFHLILALASGYMAMLLTNWGSNRSDQGTAGKGAFWAQVACLFVNQILFVWTLVAPMICPSRFQQDTDE